MAQRYSNFQNEPIAPPPYVVVNQQPPQPNQFPISFSYKIAFVFGILKSIIGFVEFTLGIVQVFTVDYFTSRVGFPIWCGLTILVNGLFGIILKWKQTKCMIASFYALSITSLILSVLMMIFYSMALNYFVEGGFEVCSYGYHPYWRYYCHHYLSVDAQNVGKGLLGFLLFMVICELACSIGSVVLSCRAYSKFCNTCDGVDCCTCFGCCECDTQPLGILEGRVHQFASAPQNANFVPRPPDVRSRESPYQHPAYTDRVDASGSSAQSANPMPNISNPCSALFNIIIQVPDSSRLISSSDGAIIGATPINLSIQSNSANR